MKPENCVRIANQLEALNLDFEEIKDFLKNFFPYVYVFVKDFITDPQLLEILMAVGDELLKKYLDKLFLDVQPQAQSASIFETFMQFLDPTPVELNFMALQKRIEENSPLLNQEIYRVILEAYQNYKGIQQRFYELSQSFDDKISNLKSQTIKNKPEV